MSEITRYENFINHLIPSYGVFDFTDKETNVTSIVNYFLSRTQSMFIYKNLPDSIPQDILEMMIQGNGYTVIIKHNEKLYSVRGGFGGEPDEYYRPTVINVTNPYLDVFETFTIDKNCILIKNDTFLQGLIPLLTKYATLLAENELSIKCATINLRIKELISAPDDRTKKSAEQYLENIENGKTGIIAENSFLDGIKVHPTSSAVSQSTLTNLIEMEQYLKASLYNELGINANYNMKRESINSAESQLNNESLQPFIDNMLTCRKNGIEKVNAMFGTNISVELSSIWQPEQEQEQEQETQPERFDLKK